MRQLHGSDASGHPIGGQLIEKELEREIRRFFRRFTEPDAYAVRLGEGGYGLFVARSRGARPVMTVESHYWEAFERHDLVRKADASQHPVRWHASEAGKALFRRLEACSDDPFRAQHQLRAMRSMAPGGDEGIRDKISIAVNEAENPLGWLRRRKGPDGKPLISEQQFEAGERLQADFILAQMNSRVTMDWSMALAPGGRRQIRGAADLTDRAIAARTRLARALDAVGTGLSGILLEVCCSHRGLEEIERGFGWPRRSGKVVLSIALDRLAGHFGIESGGQKLHSRDTKQRADNKSPRHAGR